MEGVQRGLSRLEGTSIVEMTGFKAFEVVAVTIFEATSKEIATAILTAAVTCQVVAVTIIIGSGDSNIQL